MDIEQSDYDRIAREIHSETSPVGIDAKRTHVLILNMLEHIHAQLNDIQSRVAKLEK